MRCALLFVAASALLRAAPASLVAEEAPCHCSSLLQESGSSPCGCGTGIVRKVHTREELESQSQAQLDKLNRDSQDELDELKGTLIAQEKEHKEELQKLNDTTQGLQDQLWGTAGAAKGEYKEGYANLTAEREEVATLEADLKIASTKNSDLKFEFSKVQEEIGIKLMVFSGCECKEADSSLLLKKSTKTPTLAALKLESHSGDPARVKLIETAMEIEKLEAELVLVTKDLQADQAEYDAGVNYLQEQQEKMKLNNTQVLQSQDKNSQFLDTRATAQSKARGAIERMLATKTEQNTGAEKHLADAKSQLEKLAAELTTCGC